LFFPKRQNFSKFLKIVDFCEKFACFRLVGLFNTAAKPVLAIIEGIKGIILEIRNYSCFILILFIFVYTVLHATGSQIKCHEFGTLRRVVGNFKGYVRVTLKL
jgi:hypothetical protein